VAGFRIYEPTLLANPFHIEDGLACVPAGSCPGVEISGDALAKYRVKLD